MKEIEGFSRKVFYVYFGLLILAGIGYVICRIKGIDLTEIYPDSCLLYKQEGLYCPGCGGTRAVKACMEGDYLLSLKYHPAVLYVLILIGSYMASHIISICSGGRLKGMRFNPVHFYILAAVIILQCIVKNIFVIKFGIYII